MKKEYTVLWKILIPVLIVAVIVGMWIYKSGLKNPASIGGDGSGQETQADLAGGDFSLHMTQKIDFAALSAYGLPIIADYGSDSCIPCKEMAPVLAALNSEMKTKAFIKFVDVWKYRDAAADVPIQLIPSQVIFNADGTPYMPSDALKQQIGGFKFYRDFTVHEGGLTDAQMRAILAEMGVE